MADILIREVPEGVIAAIDEKAKRLGLSRSEYLRRTLARERDTESSAVSVSDLASFADTFADLSLPPQPNSHNSQSSTSTRTTTSSPTSLHNPPATKCAYVRVEHIDRDVS